jgi:hypothetical protein
MLLKNRWRIVVLMFIRAAGDGFRISNCLEVTSTLVVPKFEKGN